MFVGKNERINKMWRGGMTVHTHMYTHTHTHTHTHSGILFSHKKE